MFVVLCLQMRFCWMTGTSYPVCHCESTVRSLVSFQVVSDFVLGVVQRLLRRTVSTWDLAKVCLVFGVLSVAQVRLFRRFRCG
jgi:hypothetical protein